MCIELFTTQNLIYSFFSISFAVAMNGRLKSNFERNALFLIHAGARLESLEP